jgi:hypothetical protein
MRIAHPPAIPTYWTPRKDVLRDLDSWWRNGAETVLVLHGIGGAGKSTVIHSWLNEFVGESGTGNPDGLFQFSHYEHGDRTFADFLAMANAQFGTLSEGHDKVDALLDVLAERRVLVVLDGAERLLREYATAAPELVEELDPDEIIPRQREIVDEEAWRFVQGLASRKLRGRVILTSRLMPCELDDSRGCRCRKLTGLDSEQAVKLLRNLGILGTDVELAEAAARFEGHPFSLQRLANVLRADPDSPNDVRRAPSSEAIIDLRRRREDIFNRAFKTLTAKAQAILFLLSAA